MRFRPIEERRVDRTEFPEQKLFVSTVCLDDMALCDDIPYETMVFPITGPMSEHYCERSATKEDAILAHKKACEMVLCGDIK